MAMLAIGLVPRGSSFTDHSTELITVCKLIHSMELPLRLLLAEEMASRQTAAYVTRAINIRII